MAGVISESLLNLHWLIGFRYLGSDPQDLGDFAKLPEHGHSSERAAGLTLSAAEVRRDPRTQSDRHRRRHDHGLRSQIPRVRHSATQRYWPRPTPLNAFFCKEKLGNICGNRWRSCGGTHSKGRYVMPGSVFDWIPIESTKDVSRVRTALGSTLLYIRK